MNGRVNGLVQPFPNLVSKHVLLCSGTALIQGGLILDSCRYAQLEILKPYLVEGT